MNKPNTVRTSEWLVYLKLAFSAIALVMNIAIIMSPSLQQKNKVNLDQFTAGELALNVVFLAVPVAAAIFTIYFIRRRKRSAALMTAVALLIFSTANQIQMLLGAVIVFLLFTRSARAYFNNTLHADKETVPETQVEEQAVDLQETRPVPAVKSDPVVDIRPAGVEDAGVIHTLMMEAFEEYRAAIPPSSALKETVESVRDELEAGQAAAIVYEDERPVAMVRYEVQEHAIYFFRLSVIPSRRRRGYAKRLVRWIEHQGRSQGLTISRCKVRQTVQDNVAMYQDMGYEIVDQELVVMPEGSVKAVTMEKKLLA